jgi:hypothetical protein
MNLKRCTNIKIKPKDLPPISDSESGKNDTDALEYESEDGV